MLDMMSHSVDQTINIGQQIGAHLQPGDLVLLQGTMGVGKTYLAKGIVQGLGSSDMATSPSFVLINEYRAGERWPGIHIHHADLYRIEDPAELPGIGLDELWHGSDICLVEWPERATDWLPAAHLTILLEYLDEPQGRIVRLQPQGEHYQHLIEQLRQTVAV